MGSPSLFHGGDPPDPRIKPGSPALQADSLPSEPPGNPMSSVKGQKEMTPKDESPRLVGVQYATGDQWRNNSRKNEEMSQSKNSTQLWMRLVKEVKSDAVKSNIA